MFKATYPTAHWQPHHYAAHELPSIWRDWLMDSGSLTLRLKQCWPDDFHLQLLQQRWGQPSPSERCLLQLPQRRWALVREVLLSGGGQPRVFARTLIPSRTLRLSCPKLSLLGVRALGETLFNQPALQRSAFTYGALPAHTFQPLLAGPNPNADVWGRRSLFYLAGEPLLVSEFFLS